MPTDVGAGALADRLRNFLRLTGRIPLKMDENVVPVIVGQNVDVPPWRTSDSNWSAFPVSVAPAAGFFAAVGIELPVRSSGVCRVTQLVLHNDQATAAAFDIRVGARGTTNYTRQGNVFNTEQMTPVPAVIPTVTPEFFDFNENPLATGNMIGRVRVPPNDSKVVPVDVCLRGNFGQSNTLGQSLWIISRTAAIAIGCQFSGTMHPQAA